MRTGLTEVFRLHGLPERMLMDNGSPWNASRQSAYSQLTVWLLQLDIAVTHGRPYHPQTQGKEERLHRTLKEELVLRHHADTLTEWQRAFDQWRDQYNQVRPHQALADQPPCTRYQPSPRPFPDTLPMPEYPASMAVRRVDSAGRISYRNHPLRVGKAFAGLPVGVRVDEEHEQWQVHFSHFCIQRVDGHTLEKL